jgi:MarR family transcriptional regulator, organic hydroperoxide resistance regulator
MSAADPSRISSEVVDSGPEKREVGRVPRSRLAAVSRAAGRSAPPDADRSAGADLVRQEREVRARLGGLPIDPHALAAVSNVFRVANAVRLHMERQVLGADGISWTGFVVLWVLWVWGEQEARHLAAECGVSKATLTGVLGTLEGRGLVARRRHAEDGRLVIVKLTPTGRRVIRRLFPRFYEHEALVVSRLGTDEQDQLAHLLREVLRAVEAAEAEPTS